MNSDPESSVLVPYGRTSYLKWIGNGLEYPAENNHFWANSCESRTNWLSVPLAVLGRIDVTFPESSTKTSTTTAPESLAIFASGGYGGIAILTGRGSCPETTEQMFNIQLR